MWRYFASGWLIIDIVSTILIEKFMGLFLADDSGTASRGWSGARLLRVLRLVRLLKLLRLVKVVGFIGRFQNSVEISQGALTLSKMVLQIAYIARTMACMFFFLHGNAMKNDRDNSDLITWYRMYNIEDPIDYIRSLYWYFTTQMMIVAVMKWVI